ncbi:MAG: hypothetical protein WCV99_24050 [Sterolibacterium sp.]|jgi:DNA-binding transcriptional regulator YiaG
MKNQAEILRSARETLEINSEGLAELLGVSLATLRSWIAPESSKMHREMPKTAQLLLDRILLEIRRSKSRVRKS